MSTNWNYLTSYHDHRDGAGGTIIYQTAYNNANGAPGDPNNRYDPTYCATHSCPAPNDHPDLMAWSEQIVTSITAAGKGTSASNPALATTGYQYKLAKTGTGCGGSGDCVGDTWLPPSDSDWQDFFHGEFHGFAKVYIVDPAGNLTVQQYASTLGWGTAANLSGNYTAGQLYEEDLYSGNAEDDTKLLGKTVTTYAGNGSTHDSCSSTFTSTTYKACEVIVMT